ncbi:uncharacterized protein LOC117334661 isoform X2 [Pecten maximus]|uniref:uncharacterized protein LOC117334661 isoform X2 n=1 Tax=Pecten maximus TaxID=6579 RepID=UPI001458E915|nr:uncharacterized protein LOC117334661 isoform X2 [Pecten maximus]
MEDVVTEQQACPESKPTENTEETGYMLIDNEEVLIRQLCSIREEFSNKIASVRRELEVQWEVLSRLLLFMAPITITWAVTMFVRLAGNRTWEGYAAAVSCGVILSLMIFDLHGLLNVILDCANIRQYGENTKILNNQPIVTGSGVNNSEGQNKETNTEDITDPTPKEMPVEDLPLPD